MITIVVLLILAGISITVLWGENGIIRISQQGKLEYEIAQAREKLEVVLSGAKIEKHTNEKYNENEYLDGYILNAIKEAKVVENIVILDKYAFELDRTIPKIGKYLGKEEELVFPEVELIKMIAENKETATIEIKAREKEEGIHKIELILDGEVIQTYTYENEKGEIKEECVVAKNGNYKVKVYSKMSITKSIKIEELIEVIHLKLEKQVISANRQALIKITAKEIKEGINKIEVLANGEILKEYQYENRKDEIIENYTAERNTVYTVKVYAKESVEDFIEITGLIRIAVGDYVDYVPDDALPYPLLEKVTGSNNYGRSLSQDKSQKWIIMNIDATGVDIISERSINNSGISLSGYIGFNNGVYLLNDICKKHYSNTSLGTVGRSINLLDIEKKFSSEGLAIRNSNESYYAKVKYGESKVYYSRNGKKVTLPDIYDHVEQTTLGESQDYYESPTTKTSIEKSVLYVKQTAYAIDSVYSRYFNDSNFFNTVFTRDSEVWIATRFADCSHEDWFRFGIHAMTFYNNKYRLYSPTLIQANNSSSDSAKIRPVVHLNANIKISEDGGTPDNPKTLSKD